MKKKLNFLKEKITLKNKLLKSPIILGINTKSNEGISLGILSKKSSEGIILGL